jgi:hypothetical protein
VKRQHLFTFVGRAFMLISHISYCFLFNLTGLRVNGSGPLPLITFACGPGLFSTKHLGQGSQKTKSQLLHCLYWTLWPQPGLVP